MAGCDGAMHDTVLDWEDELPEPDTKRAWEHSPRRRQGRPSTVPRYFHADEPRLTMPLATKERGGDLAIINPQRTVKDKHATLLLHADVDVVMALLAEELQLHRDPLRGANACKRNYV